MFLRKAFACHADASAESAAQSEQVHRVGRDFKV
jgi:hypothetical protein